MPVTEHVVLVDEENEPTGIAPKASAHHGDTPLHRGFSVFLFDRTGNLLLQQRSYRKQTWPGVWSNSCCGHPQLHESTTAAMKRRIHHELGLSDVDVTVTLPDYRYRYSFDGVVENELCPVAVGLIGDEPRPNPEEVHAIQWKPWSTFLEEVREGSGYSEWCIEEAQLLADNAGFQDFYAGLADT